MNIHRPPTTQKARSRRAALIAGCAALAMEMLFFANLAPDQTSFLLKPAIGIAIMVFGITFSSQLAPLPTIVLIGLAILGPPCLARTIAFFTSRCVCARAERRHLHRSTDDSPSQ